MLEALPSADWADGWWAIAIPIAIALIIFVLLPLLGVALELIAVIFIFCSGLIGRLFLGRPWVVEAKPLDSAGEALAVPVKGFRRAGDTATRLAREIAATGTTDHFVAAEEPVAPELP